MNSAITTHVLDTAKGCPAAGIRVTLDVAKGDSWRTLSTGVTDSDGRIVDLLPAGEPLAAGTWRLTFHVSNYFGDTPSFYDSIPIVFRTDAPADHYHVPLLLSPFSYSTYRGS